jgi:hypothetical protein
MREPCRATFAQLIKMSLIGVPDPLGLGLRFDNPLMLCYCRFP